MKKIIALILVSIFVGSPLVACSGEKVESRNVISASQSTNTNDNEAGTEVDVKQNPVITSDTISVVYDSDDEDSGWNSSAMSYINLEGNVITVDGDGTVVNGNKIAITSAGTYSIKGNLDDGQIIVRAEDNDIVKLILLGVDISCSNNSPIYVYKAQKTVITLADGSQNYVTDGDSYVFDDPESDEPNAAIFSKADLTINGSGSLTVNANYNNGIQSKDELKITGGDITVNAVNDGIKGRDFIAIKDGNITVDAGGDGMQSTNDTDTEKGFVAIEGGTINVTAAEDGIQAETSLIVSGGDITISSGGGSANSSNNAGNGGNMRGDRQNMGMENNTDVVDSTGSAKGMKAAVDITIQSGTINIDSSDDSIHSNDSLTINGGNIILASGDDGIHSDSSIEINGGDISISKCYEGLESATITINDGNIHLISSDDGVNVVGANGELPMGGQPGQNNFNFPMGGQTGQNNLNPPTDGQTGQNDFSSSANNYLHINGGYLTVDAKGDGLDINGTFNMTGGVVIVNGPTANDNGALDHSGCEVTGGFLVAAGSSGMAQAPGTSSTQYSVLLNLSSSQPANTLFHIESEDGEEILTFEPTKEYQSVVLCSPQLKNGSTYIAYSGGSSTGTVTDSLYSGGTYTPGTEITSFTISSIVTTVGSSGGGFGGGAGGGFPGGPPR